MEPITLEIKKIRLLAFKNNAPFISCISKINAVLIEKCRRFRYCNVNVQFAWFACSGSLWNYYRDELADETNDDNDSNKNVINSKSFKYKTSITGSTYHVAATAGNYDAYKEGIKKVKITVPLKHLSNFWKTLHILLINCELSLALSWSANCVITSLE